MKTKLLAFSGSTREASYNQQLVKIAAAGAEAAGATVTLISLRDFPLPLFDEDLEATQGLSENAHRLKELMKSHDGFIIASPEYNSSLTAVLKNAIDWTSRKEGNEHPLEAFSGKTAVIMSASPGALGGLRGLVHLRAILSNLAVLVIPEQRAIASANKEFNEGKLADAVKNESIRVLGKRLAEVTEKLIA